MNSEQRYRNTLRGMTPSPAWRESTLAAMKEARGRKEQLRRRPMLFAAAVAVLVLAVTGGLWWSSRMTADPNDPGVARTPEPVVTPTPQSPEVWNESFAIVTDPSQLMGENPTAGRLGELYELPVYENPNIAASDEAEELMYTLAEAIAQSLGLTPGNYTFEAGTDMPWLTLDCTDSTQIILHGLNYRSIYPASDPEALWAKLCETIRASSEGFTVEEEILEQYNFDGTAHTVRSVFASHPDVALGMQLYLYSFFNRYTLEGGNIYQAVSSASLLAPPGELIYPLRSEEDALASFRSRDYWGGHYTSHPEQAEILQVTIEYDTTEGQPYFQPVYRILYTQDYWDEVIADWMFDGVDPSPYMGVGIAYVPAIDPEYQDEVPYRRYFNDGLAHHTPEDLP